MVPQRFFIVCVYKLLYFLMGFANAVSTLFGSHRPFITFHVFDKPNSIFINYKIKNVQLFEKEMLKNQFKLAKCKLLLLNEQDKDQKEEKDDDGGGYYVSVNVYCGEVATTLPTRCEYSVYIVDPYKPSEVSMLVVEAFSSIFSYDTYKGFIRGSKVTHVLAENKYLVTNYENALYSMKCTINVRSDAIAKNTHQIHPDFVKANDRIYWRNGLCDKIYYDAEFSQAKVVFVDPADCQIAYHTGKCLEYLEPEPSSVFYYKGDLKYVVRPSVNLYGHNPWDGDDSSSL